MTKRVAVLIGGGDVPGLNMCLKSLVYRLVDLGFEPIGVRKGWEGLIQYNPHDPSSYSEHFIELTKNLVRPIDRTPGSFLHSSRVDPRHTPSALVPEHLRQPETNTQDMTGRILDVIQRLGYRAVIAIGDEDTLHHAAHLSRQGAPVIAIPKTIHNNIHGTDYTLGFSTGLARGVAFIHELRALAGSREQIVVVETFAAASGYSALLMALLSGVDRAIIPEVPYDPAKLARLVRQDQRENPCNYAVVSVCDGSQIEAEKASQYTSLHLPGIRSDWTSAAMLDGGTAAAPHLVGSGMVAAEALSHLLGEEVFHQPLTYLLRTGSPDGQDLLGAANFAFIAADLVKTGEFGRMAAFTRSDLWTHIDINTASEGVKTVDVNAWYDPEDYKPKLSLIWSANNRLSGNRGGEG